MISWMMSKVEDAAVAILALDQNLEPDARVIFRKIGLPHQICHILKKRLGVSNFSGQRGCGFQSARYNFMSSELQLVDLH